MKLGPDFGYFVNASKSVMIAKEDSVQKVETMFEGSGIQITTAGGKYLGAAIGIGTFKEAFVTKRLSSGRQSWRI